MSGVQVHVRARDREHAIAWPHPYTMGWCWRCVRGDYFASGVARGRGEAIKLALISRHEFAVMDRAGAAIGRPAAWSMT